MDLDSLKLIKDNRCVKRKVSTCENVSKKTRYLKYGETISSPTVSTETAMTKIMIDTIEGRDTAMCEVPGAFLHSEMPKDKRVIMKLQGGLFDIICEFNPCFKHHVCYKNRQKVLYVLFLKVIYGCIESYLMWYDLYVSTLEGVYFEIIPYYRYVANTIIDGKYFTLVWYVDDNNLSHKYPKVVTEILEALKKIFE